MRRLLIEEGADIKKEYYVAAVTDRATQTVALMASSEGGMDIEEVAHKTPEKIIKVFVDPLTGMTDAQAPGTGHGASACPQASQAQAVDVFKKLYACYMDTDASLAEINPLILEGNGNIKALDAKFNFDSNALFRHPEIVAYRDLDEEDPAEVEASKFDLSLHPASTATSAAWSMVPAWRWRRWTPSSCSAASRPTSSTWAAVPPPRRSPRRSRSCSPARRSRAILVNIFGGIMRCDTIAEGVVAACKAVNLSVPLVVRMKGTNEDIGKKILADSGLPIISADTMAEAAQAEIVAAVK